MLLLCCSCLCFVKEDTIAVYFDLSINILDFVYTSTVLRNNNLAKRCLCDIINMVYNQLKATNLDLHIIH